MMNPLSLTKVQHYQMKIEMTDTEGNYRQADYSTFKLLNDVNFNVKLDGFSSGDNWQVRDSWADVDGLGFSADGRDNDNSPMDCANLYKSGNW